MAKSLQERLTLITEAGKILNSSLQSQSALQRLADLISTTLADVCAIDLFRDDGQLESFALAYPERVPDVQAVLSGSASQPDPVYHVPLPIDGGTLGVMSLVRFGEPLDADEIALAEDLARMTALSLENARLYQRAQEALLIVRNQAANIRRMNADLERRVAERTAELEAVNREMSVVSYTVSHDLRAPLRAIQGYSQMLMEDFGSELSSGATNYVNKLAESTQAIRRLLDGLLDFCKFSARPLKRQVVDLGDLVREAAETLQTKMAGRTIDLRIGCLDAVSVDPLLVKQVFVNLLSNALTYTASRDVAVIEVGQCADATTTEPTFYVKDNGIGFDPREGAKLFEAFRRLHADLDIDGTGVGLTIVSGIVQRHGGRIWASGSPNAGATFYFTLGEQHRERIAS